MTEILRSAHIPPHQAEIEDILKQLYGLGSGLYSGSDSRQRWHLQQSPTGIDVGHWIKTDVADMGIRYRLDKRTNTALPVYPFVVAEVGGQSRLSLTGLNERATELRQFDGRDLVEVALLEMAICEAATQTAGVSGLANQGVQQDVVNTMQHIIGTNCVVEDDTGLYFLSGAGISSLRNGLELVRR